MERLERERRLYGVSSTSRPAGQPSAAASAPASSTQPSSRSSPKKTKLSKRDKRKARSVERSFAPPAGQQFQPPSSQKRIKLEPGTYRALLEAASPRRAQQQQQQQQQNQQQQQQQQNQQQQQRPAGRLAPQFRRINPPAAASSAAGPPSPSGPPDRRARQIDRHKTPLFLPDDDDEFADEIIARGQAREAAARLQAERAARGSPFAVRASMRPSASDSESSSDYEDGDGGGAAAFPDHVSESPRPDNAQAGPSRRLDVDDDDDAFTFLPGFEGMGRRGGPFASSSSGSPNLPDASERSPDLQLAPASTAAPPSSAAKKGKKRAAPDTDADADGPAPRKITRRRESYQAKTTAMWMREQCLTASEADDRWARYLAGRNGHKGDTFRLAMEQRQNVLLARWMKDDGLDFEGATERLRLLLEREEKEKLAKQKAAIAASKAGLATNDGAASPAAAAVANPPTPPAAKAPRKPRTSTAGAATTTTTVVKPPRSPAKPMASSSGRTSAAQSAVVGRRKGPVSNTARAVELLCATEEARSPEARLTIIDLFSAQDNSAEVYLSLPDPALRAAWVERRLREKGGAAL